MKRNKSTIKKLEEISTKLNLKGLNDGTGNIIPIITALPARTIEFIKIISIYNGICSLATSDIIRRKRRTDIVQKIIRNLSEVDNDIRGRSATSRERSKGERPGNTAIIAVKVKAGSQLRKAERNSRIHGGITGNFIKRRGI